MGKVILTSLSKLKTHYYDEAWVIVRSPGNIDFKRYGYLHVPELSPSEGLFSDYLDLKKQGLWGPDSFAHYYVPRFIDEMVFGDNKCSSVEKANKMNELWTKVKKNDKVIAIVCFCGDTNICHTSIIGGILLGVGVEVYCPVELKVDISQYYNMYDQKRKGAR